MTKYYKKIKILSTHIRKHTLVGYATTKYLLLPLLDQLFGHERGREGARYEVLLVGGWYLMGDGEGEKGVEASSG